MKHLDLFSGIGGFALAARNVGWETVGFCEIEPYCQKVLAKHWPGVPIYDDVRELRGETIGPVDIITGGFPCQDISYAGKGTGIEGERSGLWTELARIIGEVRPRYAVLENVAALLSRGLDRVAGDLAEIGYDCEWHCIPASAIGAPHRRDRIWIIAYPQHPDTDSTRSHQEKMHINGGAELSDQQVSESGQVCGEVADTHLPRLEGWLRRGLQECASERAAWEEDSRGPGSQWLAEPNVGRVANGVPARVDRLRGLGNAIVPACAELLFQAINEVER